MTSASLKKCKYFVLLQHLDEILLLTVRKVFINNNKKKKAGEYIPLGSKN